MNDVLITVSDMDSGDDYTTTCTYQQVQDYLDSRPAAGETDLEAALLSNLTDVSLGKV